MRESQLNAKGFDIHFWYHQLRSCSSMPWFYEIHLSEPLGLCLEETAPQLNWTTCTGCWLPVNKLVLTTSPMPTLLWQFSLPVSGVRMRTLYEQSFHPSSPSLSDIRAARKGPISWFPWSNPAHPIPSCLAADAPTNEAHDQKGALFVGGFVKQTDTPYQRTC